MNRNNNRKRNNKQRRGDEGQQAPLVKINRFRLTAPRMLVKLGYNASTTIADVAAPGAKKYWYANGAYDVDPSVGNVTLDGFNEWMALYAVYQVKRITVKFTACNMEAFPVRIATGFFAQAQTIFPTSTWKNLHAIEHQTLGPLTGQCRTNIRRSIALGTLVGTKAYEGDLNQYYGTGSTNPSSLASFNIGIASPTGSFLANGVVFGIDFEFDIELSYPKQIAAV